MDSNAYRKLIYFPRAYEHNGLPRVIYASETWDNREWKGSTDPHELEKGRFQYYPIRRCQPYSEALWEKCRAWIQHYEDLRELFQKLMASGEA